MHLYFMTRGIQDNVDKFVYHMKSQYLPYKRKKLFPEAPNNIGSVQVAMRPIQMWEVVFPEEHLKEVMRWVWLPNEVNNIRPHFKTMLYPMRKALNAKKLPKLPEDQPLTRIVYTNNVCAYPIGIRDDPKDENGEEDL